ncbi:PREDICTED: F-box protein CPR30-like [Fragaria vesca subsp. vesca]
MSEHIPEDVISKIFQRLPVKSLIRFTSVSKRWRSIILQDPHFAASHYQIASENKTLSHSVCFRGYFDSDCFFESQTTSSSSSPVMKTGLRCPFTKPDSLVYLYCSCRGLKLPDPGVPNEFQIFTGFGYVSATDDYKILIANSRFEEGEQSKIHIFSSKSKSWRRIQDSQYSGLSMSVLGTLCNETLHWLRFKQDIIVAFDLADEKFRIMALPVVEEYGGLGDFGGCLCVFGQVDVAAASIDLWVMREYGKGNSWTKLFNLRISDQPDKQICYVQPILVTETCTFLEIHTESGSDRRVAKLVKSYHNELKIEEVHVDRYRHGMVGYEESLLWLE